MSDWKLVGEEASIVLVGSFNPAIFHPEWFIRHKIVPEWNYDAQTHGNDQSKLAVMPDLSTIEFQDDRHMQVLLNKFVLRTSRASEYLTLKDIVSSTFGILQETPIAQMGMNHSVVIEIPDDDKWISFGEKVAPKAPWHSIAPYINELDEDRKKTLGLWDMTVQLPRPDDALGYIRPTIKVDNITQHRVSIGINSHIDVGDQSTIELVDYLNSHWEENLAYAKDLINNIINCHLEE